jgi:hypothetical protein
MSRAEKAKGAKLSAPANTRAEDSATFTDDRISCYPPEVNGADREAEREVREAFESYLSSLRKQWIATVRDWRTYPADPKFLASMKEAGIERKPRLGSAFRRPANLMDIVLADEEFRYSQTEFRRIRRMLRRQGLENVVDEIQDLRDERAEALYKWIFIQRNYFMEFPYSLDISTLDILEQENYYVQMGVMQDGITKYLSCLEEEAAIIKDTLGKEALANLRGWKSATGDDVREVKTAAESADANAAAAKTAAEGAKESAEGAKQVAKESKSLLDQIIGFFKAHIIPRTSNYAVTQKALSLLLEKFNAKVTERQIKRWEQFIKTNGRKGTKPPDGYTLETRKTLAGATAWAQRYAALESGILNTKISLEKRFGKNL